MRSSAPEHKVLCHITLVQLHDRRLDVTMRDVTTLDAPSSTRNYGEIVPMVKHEII